MAPRIAEREPETSRLWNRPIEVVLGFIAIRIAAVSTPEVMLAVLGSVAAKSNV
jgi:hypothetical protein